MTVSIWEPIISAFEHEASSPGRMPNTFPIGSTLTSSSSSFIHDTSLSRANLSWSDRASRVLPAPGRD